LEEQERDRNISGEFNGKDIIQIGLINKLSIWH